MADHQEPTISKTGVWLDVDTGHVVESEPESGKLIVAPGGEIDQTILDEITAAKVASGQPVDEPTEDADEAVDTADVTPRRGRPPGSKNKPKPADVPDDTEKATEG